MEIDAQVADLGQSVENCGELDDDFFEAIGNVILLLMPLGKKYLLS
jgi:hypothetical protein